MISFVWCPLIALYFVMIVLTFGYARSGIIWAEDQARKHAEAARLYAREESQDRDHDIEDLRKAVGELSLKIYALEHPATK